MRPLVSVVVPVFNRGPALRRTLDSALSQILEAVEIIVVDDGSTDGTPQVLQEYAGRVRLIQQPNRGVAAARNRGLEAAKGEFVAFLDHDDLWLPQKLERQLAAFGSPQIGVVYSLWREVDENGETLPDEQQTTRQGWWKPALGRAYGWLLAPRNPIVSMSVPLVRTALLREVGGFDAKTVPADDWDVWLRLARRTKFAFVPEELVLYTIHEQQQRADVQQMSRAMRRVLGKQWRGLLLRPALAWFVLSFENFLQSAPQYQAAKAALERKRFGQLRQLVRQTLRRQPLALLTPQWTMLLLRAAVQTLRR